MKLIVGKWWNNIDRRKHNYS